MVIRGLLITLAAIAVVEVLAAGVLAIPALIALFAVVALAAFIGGTRAGLVSAALVSLYAVYYFSIPGQLLHYTDGNFVRLLLTPVTSVTVVLIVGSLRHAVQISREQLRRQLRFSEAIDDSLAEGVYALDRSGRVTFLNPAAEQMLGWTQAELLGKVIHDVIHFQHADGTPYPREECSGLEVLRSGIIYRNDDDVFTRKDGTIFSVAYSSSPIEVDGQIEGVVVAFRDMTEHKRIEQELRTSEAKLRLITSQMPAHAWTTDTDLRVTSVMGSMLAQLGVDPSRYSGKTLHELARVADERQVNPTVSAHLLALEGEPANYDVQLADRIFEARVEPLRDAENRIVGTLGLALDVTERRQAEEALRVSEERFRSLVQNASDIITVIQPNGTILYQSPAIEHVLGYKPDDLVGQDFFQVIAIHPDDLDRTKDLLAELLRDPGGSVAAELRLRHTNGSWRDIAANAKNLLGDPAVGGIVTNYHDVTERKRDERRFEAQYEVGRTLAEAASLDEAVPRILHAIGDCLQWDYGALWLVDARDNVLRCVDDWHAASCVFPELAAINRRVTFNKGLGLPGHAWESGGPVWIVDAGNEPNFPRLITAASEGLHGGFGLPILIGPDVIGVLEFFSREIREPERDLLDMTEALGRQIGLFVTRQRAREAMQESEARKGAVLESALDAIITIDHTGTIVEFNPAAETTFGYPRAAAIGREMAELIIPPALRDRHRQGLALYLATGEGPLLGRRIEMRAVRADESEFPVELFIARMPTAGPPLFTGYLRDITERKRAEETIRMRARQQTALADLGRRALAIPDLSTVMDQAAHIVVETLQVDYCRILELLPDAGTLLLRAGAGWKDGYVGLATVDAGEGSLAGYALLSGDPVVVEDLGRETRFRIPPLLRDQGVVSSVAVIIHDQDRPYGVLGADSRIRRAFNADDVHFLAAVANVISRALQRRALERQLLLERDEAERLAELDRLRTEFISTISHDLRTPLTSIRAGLGMLETSVLSRLRPEEQRLVSNVRRNVDRLRLLIDDLVTLNQLEAGALRLDREPLDLRTVVADAMSAVHTLIGEKQQQLEVDLPEPLPAEGDARRLGQVVVNVLANAHQHTPPGTRIRVTGQRVDGQVQLSVRDTGPGIPPAELEAIFHRFHRYDHAQGGSGLGLAIARSMLELQGGRIWVESEPGAGATFHIALPRRKYGEQI